MSSLQSFLYLSLTLTPPMVVDNSHNSETWSFKLEGLGVSDIEKSNQWTCFKTSSFLNTALLFMNALFYTRDIHSLHFILFSIRCTKNWASELHSSERCYYSLFRSESKSIEITKEEEEEAKGEFMMYYVFCFASGTAHDTHIGRTKHSNRPESGVNWKRIILINLWFHALSLSHYWFLNYRTFVVNVLYLCTM